MKKILALALSLMMIVCVFASCNKDSAETSITVKVTIQNDGTDMYPEQTVTMKKSEDFIPTVFDAVCQVLDENEAEYETDTFANYDIIKSIDGVAESADGDKFWQVLVDGKEPEARYAALPIVEGNEIVFFFGESLAETEDAEDSTEETTEDKAPEQTADDGYEE